LLREVFLSSCRVVRIYSLTLELRFICSQFTAKKEACEERATLARNQYLLQLAATNAQQKRFYNVDFPQILKAMECEVYEKMREYLSFYTQTELRTCSAMQAAFTQIQDQAKSVSFAQMTGF
jgi:hypothetical protein